jgi:hypothetical protein
MVFDAKDACRQRRGSQVVKAGACKASFGGSIPPRASNFRPPIGIEMQYPRCVF